MSNPTRRIFQAVHRTRSATLNKNPFPLSSSSSSSSSSSPIHSPQNPLLRSLITRRRIYSSSSSSNFSSGFSNSISPEIRSTFHHHHNRSSSSFSSSSNNKLLLSSPNNTLLPPPPFNPLKLSSNFTTRSSSSSQRQQLLKQQLGFYRHFSFKTSGFTTSSKFNANFTKTLLVDKPISALRSAFVRYREAVGLQIEAFWRRNYLALLGVGAFGLCMLLWRIMFGIADTFIGFSEGMAKYGFLALSTAIVAFAGLYVRSRFTINPDKVYRIAMRRLNTSAEILEVMGAPLSGTDLRAYVMSAGGLRLKNFKPKLGGKRCFLIFPIRGSERKGLVSVEVKKRKGQYDMKLLAVDVPMTTGPDQRFFLIGDEEEYKVGGGLISELRDPIVKAMAAVKEFEALDQKEDEEDAERELEEAERKNREEIEKLEKGG